MGKQKKEAKYPYVSDFLTGGLSNVRPFASQEMIYKPLTDNVVTLNNGTNGTFRTYSRNSNRIISGLFS